MVEKMPSLNFVHNLQPAELVCAVITSAIDTNVDSTAGVPLLVVLYCGASTLVMPFYLCFKSSE